LDISLAFFPTFIASLCESKKKDLSLSFSSRLRDEKLVLREGARPFLSRNKQEFFFFFVRGQADLVQQKPRPKRGFLGIFMWGGGQAKKEKTSSFS